MYQCVVIISYYLTVLILPYQSDLFFWFLLSFISSWTTRSITSSPNIANINTRTFQQWVNGWVGGWTDGWILDLFLMDYKYIEYFGTCLTSDDHYMNKANFVDN